LLVDYPDIGEIATQAEANAANARPNATMYKTESIINWEESVIDGSKTLSKVVLVEDVSVKVDEFKSEVKQVHRVLDLFDGFYRVRLFESKDDVDTQVGEDIFPLIGGNRQTSIPFYFYPTVKVQKPLLIGLVNMNLSHYKTTADYEHGCHLSGLPTLFISGYTPEEGHVIYIGGPTAQALPESDAKAFYAEVKNNFEALRNNLKDKEKRMVTLGTRALQEQQRQVESAETASIHLSGEVSTLAAMSISLSVVFNKAITKMIEWAGSDNAKVTVLLNRDFVPMHMSAQTITALLGLVQAGEMSKEAFFWNIKQGEFYKDSDTYELEQERINANPPPSPDIV